MLIIRAACELKNKVATAAIAQHCCCLSLFAQEHAQEVHVKRTRSASWRNDHAWRGRSPTSSSSSSSITSSTSRCRYSGGVDPKRSRQGRGAASAANAQLATSIRSCRPARRVERCARGAEDQGGNSMPRRRRSRAPARATRRRSICRCGSPEGNPRARRGPFGAAGTDRSRKYAGGSIGSSIAV